VGRGRGPRWQESQVVAQNRAAMVVFGGEVNGMVEKVEDYGARWGGLRRS
jgi:hypothetical protein